MAKPIHLFDLMIEEPIEQHLLSLTQLHLNLAVEHSRRKTSRPPRRDSPRNRSDLRRTRLANHQLEPTVRTYS